MTQNWGGEASGNLVRANAVSLYPLTVDELVQSHATSCEIYGGQCKGATGFVPENELSRTFIIPSMLYMYSFTCHQFCIILAIDRIFLWYISNKAGLLQILGSTGQKSTFTFNLQRFNYCYSKIALFTAHLKSHWSLYDA
jgi:hypothetical protein